jgi:hypothetical protein
VTLFPVPGGPYSRTGTFDRWLAALLPGPAGADRLLVLSPAGDVLFDGALVLPERWHLLAQRLGWSVLYVGTPGLQHLPPQEAAIAQALRSAAATGRLVAARVAIRRRETSGWIQASSGA